MPKHEIYSAHVAFELYICAYDGWLDKYATPQRRKKKSSRKKGSRKGYDYTYIYLTVIESTKLNQVLGNIEGGKL